MSAIHITKANFETEVLKSTVPVLIDFWAPWCSPCRSVAPIIEELSDEFSGKAKIGKINVDEEQELAQEFKVMSIPTILVFKDGKVANKMVGFRDKKDLIKLLGF